MPLADSGHVKSGLIGKRQTKLVSRQFYLLNHEPSKQALFHSFGTIWESFFSVSILAHISAESSIRLNSESAKEIPLRRSVPPLCLNQGLSQQQDVGSTPVTKMTKLFVFVTETQPCLASSRYMYRIFINYNQLSTNMPILSILTIKKIDHEK